MELTPEENALASHLSFDEDVLRLVKNEVTEASSRAASASDLLEHYRGHARGRLTQAEGTPPEGFSVDLALPVEGVALGLRQRLMKQGYLSFVSRRYSPWLKDSEPGRMTVLKTRDQFEIIRAGYPEGNDDYVDNTMITSQLREWDRRYGVTIIGANGDWLDILCKITMDEAARMGAEAVALCPDLRVSYMEAAEEHARRYYPFRDDEEGIEQQIGYVVGRDVARSQRLFLWWD